jgi:hypothetical protein
MTPIRLPPASATIANGEPARQSGVIAHYPSVQVDNPE